MCVHRLYHPGRHRRPQTPRSRHFFNENHSSPVPMPPSFQTELMCPLFVPEQKSSHVEPSSPNRHPPGQGTHSTNGGKPGFRRDLWLPAKKQPGSGGFPLHAAVPRGTGASALYLSSCPVRTGLLCPALHGRFPRDCSFFTCIPLPLTGPGAQRVCTGQCSLVQPRKMIPERQLV